MTDFSVARAARDTERHRRNLEAFIIRARRVESHSLMNDIDFVQRVANGQFTVRFVGGTQQVKHHVPENEEQVESATARVRPLVLAGEATHGAAAIRAIRYLVRDHPAGRSPDLQEDINGFAEDWAKFNSSKPGDIAYTIHIGSAETGETSTVLTSHDLAWAWVYGDVVHADPDRLEQTAAVGIWDRYLAGSILVCRIMVVTVSTLNMVRHLQAHGILNLPDEVFSVDVVVPSPGASREVDRVASAEVGTPIPSDLRSPGDGWRSIGDVSADAAND